MLQLQQPSLNEQQRRNQVAEEHDWELETLSLSEECEDRQVYLPTPWEIQEQCREIRRGWSESEHRKRAGYRQIPLEIGTTPCRIALHDLSQLEYS